MRTIHISVNDLDKRTVYLGIQGESNRTRLLVDCTPIFRQYPNASAELIIRPPVGDDYQAAILRDGNTIAWTITAADLQQHGSGEMQLVFREGVVVAMSPKARTMIEKAL